LQKTNAELEEKAHLLAEQKTEVEAKNREVEQAKAALEEKAEQLALTSKYKSEFLANMSHELRTPLNNLLILAQMLSENVEKTLLPKQVKFAETIHSSGTDLLALINDILDLSKIESGKMDVEIGSVPFHDLRDYCSRTFKHVADGKSLDFSLEVAGSLAGETVHTDAKRLQQVLKNLLSNALKFTERGSVKLRIDRAESGWSSNHPVLNRSKNVVAFSVTDTGIGIPQEKQRIIFEAFQQADGTTSRKYGGTGLGLSISRELARLLGGEIRLQSVPGTGSTFTLYLPQIYVAVQSPVRQEPVSLPAAQEVLKSMEQGEVDIILPPPSTSAGTVVEDLAIDDDRNLINPGDPVILIVEDDPTFARILLDLARDRGLKALIALRGSSALALAREFKPGAITLDIQLPDMVGWTILDLLKHDPATRHVPVHIISGDENRRRGMALGAMSFLEKSLTRDSLVDAFSTIEASARPGIRKLMLVSPDTIHRNYLYSVLAGEDIRIINSGSGGEALAIAAHEQIDGLVIDAKVTDIPAVDLVREIQGLGRGRLAPPMVLYGPGPFSPQDTATLSTLSRNSRIRLTQTPERLLDETTLLLHRSEADMSERQRQALAEIRRNDNTLERKKVLVVDDDLRNIFALTSILEQHLLTVLHAENGRAGIDVLMQTPNVDAVLMDIMMPEMDGYETTRAIRKIPQFRKLPIIALTAKAMKGDRDKCLEAGASDYVPKPVNLEQLFSVLRVWISRGHETQDDLITGAVH
jgi:signal transduction histidine kinase/DNA-binding response OmpR family regulator